MEKKREPLRYRPVAEADSKLWREVSRLNKIIDAGCYIVHLKHGAGNDELPLPLCDQEHYIVATLIVTESGTEKLQKNRVIGQTLVLSQCNDGQTGIYYRSLALVDGEQVWSEWNALLSTGQFNEIADGSTNITLEVKDNSVTAQKLSADVRKKVDSPLRPLYIAAGAEYNDSAVDVTKIAPWGEIVTHKAWHYYLNGLGDITEEQMMRIYNSDCIKSTFPIAQYKTGIIRTTLASMLNGGEGKPISFYYLCSNAGRLEVFCNTKNVTTFVDNLHGAFANCKKLVNIIPIIEVSSISYFGNIANAFSGCESLMLCKLKNLKFSVSFAESSGILKESILYTIQNASPTSAITITLHPNAYARLADDAEIVAALEAQPLVSLVSA